ncbi:rhophilin-2-A isoform X3 [Vanessa atalanta]|uniref:rhophilin-2-A isoform X3 n=1 Tax=Vanessa atalanta TaxID=42275 RepID=UPI001FCDFB0F|nr:rhophilin-2-A isoform X3 [Vanessa atalanta]
MGDTQHKTCVRVNSADDESRDEVDHELPKKNPFVRGSDPRVATCRGRLQTRRCQLNQEINKELRLRAGAENLFKATTNRKLRETVALELSFVNSNLQLLKEQLAELNSSVELYQNDSKDCVMPMIPLGLKETKEVDFREPFKDFILEHYSEDAAAYEDSISDFMDMRQAIRTPVRSTAGVALLFKYYNQLYYIERRFFPPDRSLGVYFEWFDSLTGVPSCQRTVAFEKACVLFNIAGIYTQIGAKQERATCAGLDGAVDALLRAAGALRYIHENFTNAPSVDLAADTLLVLGTLMTAQARECLFEKLQLQARAAPRLAALYAPALAADGFKFDEDFDNTALGRAHLAEAMALYEEALRLQRMCRELRNKEALSALVLAARERAGRESAPPADDFADILDAPDILPSSKFQLALTPPDFAQYRVEDLFKSLGPIAVFSAKRHWSAPRLIQLQKPSEKRREARRDRRNGRKDDETKIERRQSDKRDRSEDNTTYYNQIIRSDEKYSDDYDKHRVTKQNGVYINSFDNNFDYHPKVLDDKYGYKESFKDYGKSKNGKERIKGELRRVASEYNVTNSNDDEGFGFSVRGDAPVMIAGVEPNSLADIGGMREGDFIISIGDRDVKWSSHEEVVRLIRAAPRALALRLASPMDTPARDKASPEVARQSSSNQGSVSGASSASSGSTALTARSGRRPPSWNPFKRHSHVPRAEHTVHNNVMFR